MTSSGSLYSLYGLGFSLQAWPCLCSCKWLWSQFMTVGARDSSKFRCSGHWSPPPTSLIAVNFSYLFASNGPETGLYRLETVFPETDETSVDQFVSFGGVRPRTSSPVDGLSFSYTALGGEKRFTGVSVGSTRSLDSPLESLEYEEFCRALVQSRVEPFESSVKEYCDLPCDSFLSFSFEMRAGTDGLLLCLGVPDLMLDGVSRPRAISSAWLIGGSRFGEFGC